MTLGQLEFSLAAFLLGAFFGVETAHYSRVEDTPEKRRNSGPWSYVVALVDLSTFVAFVIFGFILLARRFA
jgi:hypothetical protein